MMNTPALCNFEAAKYFLISSNVPSLVYYSHIPLILISLIIAIIIFLKDRHKLSNQVLLFTLTPFVLWVFFSLLFWANNRSDIIMTAWALTLLVEPLIYIGGLYLFQVLVRERDISFLQKLIISLLYLPIILSLPTRFALTGFDISSCLSVEGPIALYYTYLIEGVFMLWIIAFFLKEFIIDKYTDRRKKITLIFTGIILFLLSFSWGNIIGSFTDNWAIGEFGLLGMPIFMGFLAYNIIRFKLFNLKIIGANILVFALWILTASLLAIQDIDISHVVTAITLVISIIFGLILIYSVRNEVRQREHIEALASDLTKANTRLLELDKQKSEFVSFATHQLRAPLTAMKGYSSLIMEGELGETTPEIKKAIGRIFDSSNTLTNIVDDYLNISRIELGTMKYTFDLIDLKDLVGNVIEELRPNIEKKQLKINFLVNPVSSANPVASSTPSNPIQNSNNTNNSQPQPQSRFLVHADKDKMKQVIANLVDNSVKYTPSGSMDISIKKDVSKRKVLFSIKDTGVGISPEVMPKLFTKFVRATNANKQNIYGTGLGLYVAKQIVLAHKGRLWAESEGEGKGSTFFLELDMEV